MRAFSTRINSILLRDRKSSRESREEKKCFSDVQGLSSVKSAAKIAMWLFSRLRDAQVPGFFSSKSGEKVSRSEEDARREREISFG
jgi:hypothetical protein